MATAARDFRELRLEGVSREFGSFRALSDITLSIRRGEFVALLGPSGCGKSTALNCLAGLIPITAGAIHLDGRRIDTLRPEHRGFGMVFQNYALFPHMTLARNVGFGLRMQGRPKAEIARRVTDALALVRLSAQADRLPGQISGGQQQRVAIARAVAAEPPLVLMDEPLSNLDAKLRLEMRAEIRRIHDAAGSATIYVTHDQDEALSMADRIVVMRDGAIRQVGTPEELYARPAHPDVAAFMGYRNLLPATAPAAAAPGSPLAVTVEGASLSATAATPLSPGAAQLAVRPEDLTPRPGGPLRATATSAEYRGRDFYGVARTEAGLELFFRAEHRVAPGDGLELGADPARALVFPA